MDKDTRMASICSEFKAKVPARGVVRTENYFILFEGGLLEMPVLSSQHDGSDSLVVDVRYKRFGMLFEHERGKREEETGGHTAIRRVTLVRLGEAYKHFVGLGGDHSVLRIAVPVGVIRASRGALSLPYSSKLSFLPHLTHVVSEQAQDVDDVEPVAEVLIAHVEPR